MYESITDRIKRENKYFNSNSWNLQYPTFTNGQNNQTEDQQINRYIPQIKGVLYLRITILHEINSGTVWFFSYFLYCCKIRLIVMF